MSETFSCDAVVIGAGVVGLALGRALAQRGLETFILEKNAHFGMETSARNSEVIHAGIYYPKGSLKAQLCVPDAGCCMISAKAMASAHKRLGKLIVATHAGQEAQLAAIAAAATDNGVHDLKKLSKAQIAALEPDLFAVARLAFAFDRHHRQPSIYAGPAGRCRKRRRLAGKGRGSHRHRPGRRTGMS